MNSKDQGVTIVSCSSNRSVYVDLLTAELIVDPVALNKQESFFSIQSCFLIKRKQNE